MSDLWQTDGLSMIKQILLDQIDDRVKRALALIIFLYPKLLNKELEPEEMIGLFEITDSLNYLMKVIYDVQYNNNIDKYKDDVFNIAKGIGNE